MREILFRGKTEDPSEWVVGFLIYDISFGEPCIVGKNDAEWVDGWEWRMNAHEVIPKTIGQYTGLKDKNGTRIFEGDIIYTPSFFGISEKRWVSFQDGAFGVEWPHGDGTAFQAFTSFVSSVKWEVAGNIHDNPELGGEE